MDSPTIQVLHKIKADDGQEAVIFRVREMPGPDGWVRYLIPKDDARTIYHELGKLLSPPRMAQHRGPLVEQLRALVALANQHGLYDAADFVKGWVEE